MTDWLDPKTYVPADNGHVTSATPDTASLPVIVPAKERHTPAPVSKQPRGRWFNDLGK